MEPQSQIKDLEKRIRDTHTREEDLIAEYEALGALKGKVYKEKLRLLLSKRTSLERKLGLMGKDFNIVRVTGKLVGDPMLNNPDIRLVHKFILYYTNITCEDALILTKKNWDYIEAEATEITPAKLIRKK